LRQSSAVLYLAMDALIPLRGRPIAGLGEFAAAMEYERIPLIWISSRNRFQLDPAIRSLGHAHPFVAEGACGVYLPEGYFNVRPARTIRFGRFTCIPIAERHPAAAEALQAVSEETGVPVVSARSLSPRELAQNSGLPAAEAELLRHRDFDELFFFAGASDRDTDRFRAVARENRLQLRSAGPFWSAAVGASLSRCVQELNGLYQRALRQRPYCIGVAAEDAAPELLPLCDQRILLISDPRESSSLLPGAAQLRLRDPGTWEALRAALTRRG